MDAESYRAANREVANLRAAGADNAATAAAHHLVHLSNAFEHRSTGGRHVCMAFDLLGDDLASVLSRCGGGASMGLPLPAVRAIARQTLQALDYLHRCGPRCAIDWSFLCVAIAIFGVSRCCLWYARCSASLIQTQALILCVTAPVYTTVRCWVGLHGSALQRLHAYVAGHANPHTPAPLPAILDNVNAALHT